MMKLNIMRAVVDTLNEHGESAIADEILSSWEQDTGSAHFFRASANFVFRFKQSGQPYILRFNHTSERTLDAIHAEIAYLNHLSAHGIYIAQPIRSVFGRYVESVRTLLGTFHAVVFEVVSGQQRDMAELTPAQFTTWGKALGELHNAAQGYTGSGRPTWQDHLRTVAESLPPHEQAARDVLDALKRRVGALPIHDRNFGLIHFDFELDNIFWAGHRLGIVDFDDSAWYWFVADIAFALRDLFDDRAGNVDLGNESLLAFVDGYRTARDVAEEDLQLIPLFLRMHNLIMFSKLLRTLEPGAQYDEPAWLGELRQKLARALQTYRNEFSRYTL